MNETARCPHCGAPLRGPGPAAGGLDSLYQEVHRIREIAEARQTAVPGDGSGDPVRIAELRREVAELRATVARLRGTL